MAQYFAENSNEQTATEVRGENCNFNFWSAAAFPRLGGGLATLQQ
jgi:hypothetical protein